MDLSAAFNMTPEEAVAYLRSKGYAVSHNWWEVWQEANAKAFTVAKAAREDILTLIKTEIEQSLKDGTTQQQFIDRLRPQLEKAGWWGKQIIVDSEGDAESVQLGSPRRLQTIYRTNQAVAYARARYQRQFQVGKHRPYWKYIAVMDSRTRPSHSALHGRVFRYDDPIWDIIYPPNGWGCRCGVITYSQRQLDREGLKVESGASYIQRIKAEAGVDKKTGEVIEVDHARINLPGGQVMEPDVGWAYNPAKEAA